MKTPLTCRLLYAEDDEDSCAMMKVLLGFAGIEVIAAKTTINTISIAKMPAHAKIEKLIKISAR